MSEHCSLRIAHWSSAVSPGCLSLLVHLSRSASISFLRNCVSLSAQSSKLERLNSESADSRSESDSSSKEPIDVPSFRYGFCSCWMLHIVAGVKKLTISKCVMCVTWLPVSWPAGRKANLNTDHLIFGESIILGQLTIKSQSFRGPFNSDWLCGLGAQLPWLIFELMVNNRCFGC